MVDMRFSWGCVTICSFENWNHMGSAIDCFKIYILTWYFNMTALKS